MKEKQVSNSSNNKEVSGHEDSFSFEGVRRVLENDLALNAFALPAHKSVLRQRSKEKSSALAIRKDKMKKAMRKRAAYFKDNSSTLTFVDVRRILERDLKLHKRALDSHRDFLREQLDEVLDKSKE